MVLKMFLEEKVGTNKNYYVENVYKQTNRYEEEEKAIISQDYKVLTQLNGSEMRILDSDLVR